MSTCCQNTVTPRMIKAGNVSVGDKILFEEESVLVSAQPEEVKERKETREVNTANAVNEVNETKEEAVLANSPRYTVYDERLGIEGIPGGVVRRQEDNSQVKRLLPFSEMTSYLSNVSTNSDGENPYIIVPQNPLTPDGFQEEIDSTALQSFNGFLRTQIGRYVRMEQLVSTDRTEDRLGFLVGVGSNFVILQDITTGNIMVIDIFSIRLTYIYYSSAVLPSF